MVNCTGEGEALEVDFDEDGVGVSDVWRGIIARYRIDRNSTAVAQPNSTS